MIKVTVPFFKQLPAHEKRITSATAITMLRIALVLPIIMSMLCCFWELALGLFVVAALTDIMDGFVARQFGQTTFLGACLDPVADKLLVLGCLGTFVFMHSSPVFVPAWFFFFMLFKEIIVVGGAFALYYIHGYVHIMPTLLGKLTTCMHALFIGWLLFCCVYHCYSVSLFYCFLGLAVSMVALSLVQYGSIGVRSLVVS